MGSDDPFLDADFFPLFFFLFFLVNVMLMLRG
uniref:Uncharacterized protein MANES_06G082500 n=1 Tax=Rhizophora mucronata TaxID=61149 RepID=A0A2P2J0G8_RHIMU